MHSFSVRRGRTGDVLDRISEELLHCNEKVGHKETTKSYSAAGKRNTRTFLRHITLEKVGNIYTSWQQITTDGIVFLTKPTQHCKLMQ